jgi:hypothetical protein
MQILEVRDIYLPVTYYALKSVDDILGVPKLYKDKYGKQLMESSDVDYYLYTSNIYVISGVVNYKLFEIFEENLAVMRKILFKYTDATQNEIYSIPSVFDLYLKHNGKNVTIYGLRTGVEKFFCSFSGYLKSHMSLKGEKNDSEDDESTG